MISVEHILKQNVPALSRYPTLQSLSKHSLRYLLNEQAFINFAKQYPHLDGIEFVEQVLTHFDFTVVVNDAERERIASQGRLVIIANHPIGSLDGLALLKLVSEIRPDVKIVANQLLMAIPALKHLLLPVNNMQGSTVKQNLANIQQHLINEGAVIIFPAGEVSRLKPNGVKDGHWRSGFLRMAKQAKAAILPIYIEGRNSWLFYTASMIYKPLATLLLVREMFKQQHKHVALHIGEAIPFDSYNLPQLADKAKIKLFKKHLYRLKHRRKGLFKTETAIAHPEDRLQLKAAIKTCELLGETPDAKQIYLYQFNGSSPIFREMGRLREIAFRAVGEGSGKRRDIDQFDQYYHHLLLWDDEALEIVGAYRIGQTNTICERLGKEGLYTDTLFDYNEAMAPFLSQGLELGRSFVQPKYWGRRSLDYLWQGIGAYLQQYPDVRYLFGPVSLSNSMPKAGKDLMVYFYQLYFAAPHSAAVSKNPYQLDLSLQQTLRSTFSGNDYNKDFTELKSLLANMGASIPTLYKQYSELCEQGGVQFLAFGVDPAFADCVDGLVLVDLTKLKPQKRTRYLTKQSPAKTE